MNEISFSVAELETILTALAFSASVDVSMDADDNLMSKMAGLAVKITEKTNIDLSNSPLKIYSDIPHEDKTISDIFVNVLNLPTEKIRKEDKDIER